jgi:hypothetical protein
LSRSANSGVARSANRAFRNIRHTRRVDLTVLSQEFGHPADTTIGNGYDTSTSAGETTQVSLKVIDMSDGLHRV